MTWVLEMSLLWRLLWRLLSMLIDLSKIELTMLNWILNEIVAAIIKVTVSDLVSTFWALASESLYLRPSHRPNGIIKQYRGYSSKRSLEAATLSFQLPDTSWLIIDRRFTDFLYICKWGGYCHEFVWVAMVRCVKWKICHLY